MHLPTFLAETIPLARLLGLAFIYSFGGGLFIPNALLKKFKIFIFIFY